LLLLVVVLITPTKALAEQFRCYSIFDTTTLKVRADTRGWIDMEDKPRQEVETLIDSNGDRVWVYGPNKRLKFVQMVLGIWSQFLAILMSRRARLITASAKVNEYGGSK